MGGRALLPCYCHIPRIVALPLLEITFKRAGMEIRHRRGYGYLMGISFVRLHTASRKADAGEP